MIKRRSWKSLASLLRPSRSEHHAASAAKRKAMLALGGRRARDPRIRIGLQRDLATAHAALAQLADPAATDDSDGRPLRQAHYDTAQVILLLTDADELRHQGRAHRDDLRHPLLSRGAEQILRELAQADDAELRAHLLVELAVQVLPHAGTMAAGNLRAIAYHQLRAAGCSKKAAGTKVGTAVNAVATHLRG
ncbi:hypothetical protein [Actinosynnema sp. NPDC023587]|uniref:hypothetical protein n=1 Tax=Actinosynnema sp. NPDC023587 TaxID=3154695 RepID=UPI0033D75D22